MPFFMMKQVSRATSANLRASNSYGMVEDGHEWRRGVGMRAKSLVSMVGLLCMSLFAQEKIDLSEGTLLVKGSFALEYDVVGFDKPEHKVALKTAAGGGYFFLDRLSAGLALPGEWVIAPKSAGSFGLEVFSTYYFDLKNGLFVYSGGSIIPGYSLNAKEFQLKVGLDSGVLVSLSESVALDFGMKPQLAIKMYDTQKWKLSVPFGFIGIKAVF